MRPDGDGFLTVRFYGPFFCVPKRYVRVLGGGKGHLLRAPVRMLLIKVVWGAAVQRSSGGIRKSEILTMRLPLYIGSLRDTRTLQVWYMMQFVTIQ